MGETIYQVIVGANYMDVPSLLHLGCAKIATLIKGQSLKDIKSVMTMNQQKPKRRAVILYEHWQCSEGKPLDANLQNVVFEHYAGGFEFDPKLCHKTLKLSNGNKTVTMTTNESAKEHDLLQKNGQITMGIDVKSKTRCKQRRLHGGYIGREAY